MPPVALAAPPAPPAAVAHSSALTACGTQSRTARRAWSGTARAGGCSNFATDRSGPKMSPPLFS